MRKEETSAVSEVRRGGRGTLRIGTHESTSLYLLPSLIHALNESHPGVKTEVVCGNSERLLMALGTRKIELALIGDSPDDHQIERQRITQDELVLITSSPDRHAGLNGVHTPHATG